MYPHRIRLQGPWECEPIARKFRNADSASESSSHDFPAPFRMNLPCRWSESNLSSFSGRVRFRRRFGRPRQIDAHERVWLTFAGMKSKAQIKLNDRLLDFCNDYKRCEFDVTSQLQVRNVLEVELEVASDKGLWDEAALEVRCTAFLRDVEFSATCDGATADVHARGVLAGDCPDTLEMYLILGRSTVAYRTISTGKDEQPFHLVAEKMDLWQDSQPVRLDLVHGAVIWYTVEGNVNSDPAASGEPSVDNFR